RIYLTKICKRNKRQSNDGRKNNMMLQLWRNIISGIAWGGFITFVALTVLVLTETEAPVTKVWLYMGGSLFLGVYFGLAGFIFILERWRSLKKTIIHFILSLSIYFIVAFLLGWLTTSWLAFVSSTMIFIIVYLLFCLGFYLYYRNITVTMNDFLNYND